MSSLSAIINPVTLGREVSKLKVYIYTSHATEHGLGFEQRVIDGGRGKILGDVKKTTKLRNPSTLVSLLMDDTVRVYGVEHDSNNICLVAPIHEPIPNTTAKQGYIAGCAVKNKNDNKSDPGWLYYTVVDPDNGTSIQEQSLSDTTGGQRNTGSDGILDNTWLAAFHDGATRWLVYQKKKNNVIFVRDVGVDDGDEYAVEKNNIIARQQAQIGAVFVSAADSGTNKGVAWIYFTNKANQLWRTSSKISDSLKFAVPYLVPDSGEIKPDSQISVVADVPRRRNVIYTMLKSNMDEISIIIDEWDKKAEKPSE
ncbi:hypothetical protein QBC36DRAFT_353901 [Triangularia setosa]|uniref:Uncharacterized protein n=1 Tax=Triangularia setosa TaxID=2587417 RepID=A0AAN7AC31_9PEZI|nr:hypothetical protein QBC36DRAFT_353901 [Podospora setosa]